MPLPLLLPARMYFGFTKPRINVLGSEFAGEIEAVGSAVTRFKAGDQVIATSYDIGVAHHGGYAEYARVPAQWVVALPEGLDLFESDPEVIRDAAEQRIAHVYASRSP